MNRRNPERNQERILIAAMGEFSADRTIARYLEQVWAPPARR